MKVDEFKIGVISDTHFSSLAQGVDLIEDLCQGQFADVDAILHAGDMVHPDIALLFADKPFYAVRGNNDPVVDGVPLHRIIEFGGYTIGLIHGWGAISDLESRMIDYFSAVRLDCLIYGHSHQPVCHTVGDMLVMNPGSAAQRRAAPWHSVGVLNLGDKISGEIINIDVAG